MSANDFMDFLLSYFVGFGFMVMERMYINPLQSKSLDWLTSQTVALVRKMRRLLGRDDMSSDDPPEVVHERNSVTVEPLLESYASYSCDIITLLYTPFIMLVIMAFRDEVEITKLYGIKEADMEYYVLFALAIIPFQILADIFLHNSLELLHGWKMFEYLEYCSSRFIQRESWWKGFEAESTLDGCIEESLRSMDQHCFSSQYYMLNTIHINAMVYFVLGIEMISRAEHNIFADPATVPIILIVTVVALGSKLILVALARLVGLWGIKHEKKRWHADVLDSEGPLDQWDGAGELPSHSHYEMEKRITDETFRYKFLNYNRSWLVDQLPSMITPRATQRSRPQMINSLARILGQIRTDLSDSDSDESDGIRRGFGEVQPMSAPTRSMARLWISRAQRLLRLRRLVEPLVEQARGTSCQVCLSRNLLQVEPFHSLESIDQQFMDEYRTDEIDQVLFKKFYQRTQVSYLEKRFSSSNIPLIYSQQLSELSNYLPPLYQGSKEKRDGRH